MVTPDARLALSRAGPVARYNMTDESAARNMAQSLEPAPEQKRMSIEVQQILENALALPAVERAAIIESLLSSLDQPDVRIDEVWVEEAERRIAAYEAGRMKAIPADEVFREFDHL
jgi:putative addiction module component (TIGR02574 family)